MAISEITGTEAIGTTEHSLATDTSYDTGDAQTTGELDRGGGDGAHLRFGILAGTY